MLTERASYLKAEIAFRRNYLCWLDEDYSRAQQRGMTDYETEARRNHMADIAKECVAMENRLRAVEEVNPAKGHLAPTPVTIGPRKWRRLKPECTGRSGNVSGFAPESGAGTDRRESDQRRKWPPKPRDRIDSMAWVSELFEEFDMPHGDLRRPSPWFARRVLDRIKAERAPEGFAPRTKAGCRLDRPQAGKLDHDGIPGRHSGETLRHTRRCRPRAAR